MTEEADFGPPSRCDRCGDPAFRRSRLCEPHYGEAMERVRASMGRRPSTIKRSAPPPRPTREERAAAAARHVHEHGPTTINYLAPAIGTSRRTLSRVLPLAYERGWLTTVIGSAGGIASGPERPGRNGPGPKGAYLGNGQSAGRNVTSA